MGGACGYLCENCGYRAEYVTDDFDYGFMGVVITPVVCPDHGVQNADTGLRAWDDGREGRRRDSYPCPECHQERSLWDRRTCPKCGLPKIVEDPSVGLINWD